jgi:hypothetical protein
MAPIMKLKLLSLGRPGEYLKWKNQIDLWHKFVLQPFDLVVNKY